MSDEEYQQVLLGEKTRDDEDDADIETRALYYRTRMKKAFSRGRSTFQHDLSTKALVTHCILLIANIAVATTSFFFFTMRSQADGSALTYSPLAEVISYEVRDFPIDEDHEWIGPPTPKTESNWRKMLSGFDVRVTEDDMIRLGRMDDAVEVSDEGGGYVALINVFHELHCLKLVRWSLYPDFYYPNSTAADTAERERHRDHCINYIRLSAMCHADVGVSTWHWRPNDPMPHAIMMPHTCRNWDSVDRWAKDRKVDMYQPGLLVHPTFGAAFPKGGGANEDDGHST